MIKTCISLNTLTKYLHMVNRQKLENSRTVVFQQLKNCLIYSNLEGRVSSKYKIIRIEIKIGRKKGCFQLLHVDAVSCNNNMCSATRNP